tara:strand:- start:1304 stop:1555 length:252 start_codon:yes stop_codon:yes gene_type:complete
MSGRIKHQDIFVALAQTGLTQHFEYRSVVEYDSSRRLEQFVEIIAAKAAAAEREACAKEAKEKWCFCASGDEMAQYIRERGAK